MKEKPNPGSKEAQKEGCKCPIVDNHFGRGIPLGGNSPSFWISGDCPIHGKEIFKPNEK